MTAMGAPPTRTESLKDALARSLKSFAATRKRRARRLGAQAIPLPVALFGIVGSIVGGVVLSNHAIRWALWQKREEILRDTEARVRAAGGGPQAVETARREQKALWQAQDETPASRVAVLVGGAVAAVALAVGGALAYRKFVAVAGGQG